jgi:hypothetical protein
LRISRQQAGFAFDLSEDLMRVKLMSTIETLLEDLPSYCPEVEFAKTCVSLNESNVAVWATP